jgi:hypothetical protein
MKKQQTAVEWLELYIKGITSLNCDEVIEQAKQMEKQQQIKFAKWCDNNYNTLKAYNVADLLELYNKTFKNN